MTKGWKLPVRAILSTLGAPRWAIRRFVGKIDGQTTGSVAELQQAFQKRAQLLCQDRMIFHTGMASASPCLHGREKKYGNPVAGRIQPVDLLLYRRQAVFQQQAIRPMNHRAAQQRNFC